MKSIKKYILTLVWVITWLNSNSQVADIISLADKLSGVADQLDVLVNIDEKMESLEKIEKAREALKQASTYYNDVKYIANIVTLVETTACSLRDLDETMDLYYDINNLKDRQACFTGIDYEYIITQGQTIDDMLTSVMERNNYTNHERDVIGIQAPERIKALTLDIKAFETSLLSQISAYERYEWEMDYYVSEGLSSIEIEYEPVDITDAKGFVFLLIKIALVIGLIPVILALTRGNMNPLYMWMGALVLVTVIERVL